MPQDGTTERGTTMSENVTRKQFIGTAAAMAAAGPMAAALAGLNARTADADEAGQPAGPASGEDSHIQGPENPVRTEEEAIEFLFNPEVATEDYTCADGTVIPAVYLNLRNRWNRLGVGSGSMVDDGGNYWELLMHLFTEEEAAWYLEMPIFQLFTANDYHAVSGRPEAECSDICDQLAMKGLLIRFVRGGVPYYTLTNQHLGQPMYYRQEGYLGAGCNAPDANELQYDQGTPTYQAVPVNIDVVAETEILPYDDWRATVDRNKVFVMTPCVCKAMQASFNGDFDWEHDHEARYDDGVGHAFRINTCLAMGELAEYYLFEGYGYEVTKEEAMESVQQSADEGMVVQHFYGKGSEVICQCHSDSCFLLGALRSVDGVGDAVIKMSNYTLELDKDACIQCGACIDRCPMHSVSMGDDGYPQMDAACARCGQCAVTCPAAARVLVAKPAEEQLDLPENVIDDWYEKAKYRAMKGTLKDFVGLPLE